MKLNWSKPSVLAALGATFNQSPGVRNRVALLSDLDGKVVVDAATVGSNVNLAAAPNTLDGVTLTKGARILVKDQTTRLQNGPYRVSSVGTGADGVWARATDSDATSELASSLVRVNQGTINGGTYWQLAVRNPTIGAAPLDYVRVDLDYLAGGSRWVSWTVKSTFSGLKAAATSAVLTLLRASGSKYIIEDAFADVTGAWTGGTTPANMKIKIGHAGDDDAYVVATAIGTTGLKGDLAADKGVSVVKYDPTGGAAIALPSPVVITGNVTATILGDTNLGNGTATLIVGTAALTIFMKVSEVAKQTALFE